MPQKSEEKSSASDSEHSPRKLFSYPKYWAECFDTAPYLPMSRDEMDQLGWDSCDIIIVTGDAYVDHPSFGMAVIGRLLEAQGFRVGIISQLLGIAPTTSRYSASLIFSSALPLATWIP